MLTPSLIGVKNIGSIALKTQFKRLIGVRKVVLRIHYGRIICWSNIRNSFYVFQFCPYFNALLALRNRARLTKYDPVEIFHSSVSLWTKVFNARCLISSWSIQIGIQTIAIDTHSAPKRLVGWTKGAILYFLVATHHGKITFVIIYLDILKVIVGACYGRRVQTDFGLLGIVTIPL